MPVAAPIIGAVGSIGAAAISKPKSAKDPNAYLQPYLQQGAQAAQGLFAQGGPQVYDGSTVAPMSDVTQGAIQGIVNRAQNGSPLVDTAQQYVQQGLQSPISSMFGGQANPYAISVGGGGQANPYAASVGGGATANPYAAPVSAGLSFSPYARSIGGGAQDNPYASGANPFGGATNPYLDATFNHALDSAVQGVQSRFASAGRNVGAGAPVAGDIASSLAAQIYAPAYENERNRQQAYAQQQLGIGGQGFENAQSRNLQSGLNAQNIGAQAFQAGQDRGLQSRLAGQQIGAQGFESGQQRNLTANLAGQNIGAQGFENAQSRNLQANLAGQQIGAQGFENSQNRMLSDLTSQRQLQQNLLGYASPLAAQDYLDLAQQQQAGGQLDAYAQAQLSDTVNRFNQQQQQPYLNLQTYLNNLNGLKSATGPAVQPTQSPNYLSAGLGGALLGSSLFPQKTASPYQPYMGQGGGLSADQALQYSLGGLF